MGDNYKMGSTAKFHKLEDEKAFSGILKQIIENIKNGKLKAGDTLPAERTMAETMGVSRPAVREVLRALELLGIVHTVPGGANYITENLDAWIIGPLSLLFQLNDSRVRQRQQLRAALEIESAVLAARKCTPLDAVKLLDILNRLEEESDDEERGRLDHALHEKIAEIADNPLIGNILCAANQLTKTVITDTRMAIYKKENTIAFADEQHRGMVEAIIANDEEGAARCMFKHMQMTERYMDEKMQQED